MRLQHGSGDATRVAIAGIALALAFGLAGCASRTRETPSVRAIWVVGRALPDFDPQGPPDPVRVAIERLLSRGLVEEDSSGRVIPAAAESVSVSDDGLTVRFHLRPDLTFADGTRCDSQSFRRAIESGLNRLDHGTYAWLFSALDGMGKVRAGRPLPALGITNPDAGTLVLTLAHPDAQFLRKLAFPGAAVPWRAGSGWRDGIGDYALVSASPQRLTLVRRARAPAGPDSIQIRSVPAASRVRALLRASAPDLVWPLPPDLVDQRLPGAYRALARAARPMRRLELVFRPDLPPTSKPEARHALANGLNRGELIDALGIAGDDRSVGLSGAPPFDFPTNDPEQVRGWLERGKLGRSVHVVMAYSTDGPAARVARPLQNEWAQNSIDVELRAVREPDVSAELLRKGGAQLLLVEEQAALETAAAELATLVQPMRGPPVGAFRTGWSTREFDPWIWGAASPATLDAGVAQQRLAEEHVVLPIADLPWLWVQRSDMGGRFHPRFGPDPRGFALPPGAAP